MCALLTEKSDPIALDTALHWLADPATRFQPAMQDGHAVSVKHQISLRFQQSHEGNPKDISAASEDPEPFPFYPEEYQKQSANGAVAFHFVAGSDGLPTQVGLDSVDGGDAFGRAVLQWLASGCVHYRPDFVRGQPVPTPFTRQIVHFQGWRGSK